MIFCTAQRGGGGDVLGAEAARQHQHHWQCQGCTVRPCDWACGMQAQAAAQEMRGAAEAQDLRFRDGDEVTLRSENTYTVTASVAISRNGYVYQCQDSQGASMYLRVDPAMHLLQEDNKLHTITRSSLQVASVHTVIL